MKPTLSRAWLKPDPDAPPDYPGPTEQVHVPYEGYDVLVNILRDDDGAPIPIGISVTRRRSKGTSPRERRVSTRDLKRLPLERILSAALALTASPEAGSRDDYETASRRLQIPRNGPERGKSHKFYKQIADAYRELQQRGTPSPAAEIARRMGVPPNTVHQWLLRARETGLLEWSPRAKRPRR